MLLPNDEQEAKFSAMWKPPRRRMVLENSPENFILPCILLSLIGDHVCSVCFLPMFPRVHYCCQYPFVLTGQGIYNGGCDCCDLLWHSCHLYCKPCVECFHFLVRRGMSHRVQRDNPKEPWTHLDDALVKHSGWCIARWSKCGMKCHTPFAWSRME